MAVASVSSPVRAVIWEWQRDDGGFSPYYPVVIQAIENARKSGQTWLDLGTASTSMNPYKVDLVNSKQIRTGTGMVRGIRRSEILLTGPLCHGLWEWQDAPNHYNIYNIIAMMEIEEAYTQKQPSVDLSVKPSQLPYTIDFTTMCQTRHHFNTKRKIRRTELRIPLQSYLANDPSPLTKPSVASDSSTLSLSGHLAHGRPHNHTSSSFANNVYSIPLPSVHGSMKNSATLAFDTSLYKGSLSTPKAKPNLDSAMPTTSTHASFLPSKSCKKETSDKASANVVDLTSKSSRKTKSKSTRTTAMDLTSVSNEKATSRSAKRSKIKRPTFKGAMYTSEMPFLRKVSHVKKKDDGPCPICMSELSEGSGYTEDSVDDGGVYKLTKCGHMLHAPCVKAYIENSSFTKGSFQCPTCKKIYGVKTGDMPPGTMKVAHQKSSLPGHEGYGTIQIVYNFNPGVHLGKRYSANGFPRICYLPDSPRGQQVLKLLQKAWDRKLTFTIGTSVTTGALNTIVWNEIHHKTESTSNYSGHGYPDPNYLDNVTAELSAQGVEDSADENNDSSASDEDSESSTDSDL